MRRVTRNASGIRIAGVDDVLVRLSKCCSPVPGDPIMGFVTIGRGVSVHRADCPNVAYMNAAPERILEAQWADVTDIHHAVDIEIEANDRPGLLQDIMGVCAELKTNASSVNARVKREIAVISITAQIIATSITCTRCCASSNTSRTCGRSIALPNASAPRADLSLTDRERTSHAPST